MPGERRDRLPRQRVGDFHCVVAVGRGHLDFEFFFVLKGEKRKKEKRKRVSFLLLSIFPPLSPESSRKKQKKGTHQGTAGAEGGSDRRARRGRQRAVAQPGRAVGLLLRRDRGRRRRPWRRRRPGERPRLLRRRAARGLSLSVSAPLLSPACRCSFSLGDAAVGDPERRAQRALQLKEVGAVIKERRGRREKRVPRRRSRSLLVCLVAGSSSYARALGPALAGAQPAEQRALRPGLKRVDGEGPRGNDDGNGLRLRLSRPRRRWRQQWRRRRRGLERALVSLLVLFLLVLFRRRCRDDGERRRQGHAPLGRAGELAGAQRGDGGRDEEAGWREFFERERGG